MMIKMIPDEVAAYWKYITEAIYRSVPEKEALPEAVNDVLAKCLAGSMQVWVVKEPGKAYGVVITEVQQGLGKVNNLFVYSIYLSETAPMHIVNEIRVTLIKYAIGLGCQSVYGVTDNERFVDYIRHTGGSVRYLVSLGVY